MKKAAMFIHGFLTDNNDFGALPGLLSNYYDRIECLLLPGHGDKGNIADFTCENIFNFIDQQFRTLQNEYEIIDVFGYSMGGALASYVAATCKIRNLILFAPANKYIAVTSPIKWLKAYSSAILVAKPTTLPAAAQSLSSLLTETKTSYRMALSSLPDFKANSILNFMKIIKTCNEKIKKIHNPTYILWGNLDQLVPRESCEWLFFRCDNENSHFDIYENISHIVLLSKENSLLLKRVLRFLYNNDGEQTYDNNI